MRPHVKNYLKAFGYDEADTILCEACGAVAVDIHHIEYRSKSGGVTRIERDLPGNLIALCRNCHDEAHGVSAKTFKQVLQNLVKNRIITTNH
jgi:5-methylcytosine-specific restriction endonuclease McrA